MKITEMNNCIEKMRECYKFDDDKTEIILADLQSNKSNCVTVCTKDENGTEIAMTKYLNELKKPDYQKEKIK
jgi:hypothetical protein|nr:MAG TPA: hypothetical protein [Bacteriophage sp.]